METENFSFTSRCDGLEIQCYAWKEVEPLKVKGVVQIAHGMVEHAARYQRFAKYLNSQGYLVYANDHRGHGKTAGKPEDVGYLGDKDGFERMVQDCHQLTEMIKKEHPDLPLYFFGHSMGSFITQRYIQEFGKEIKGAILSGSNGSSPIFGVAKIIAKGEIKKNGPKGKSEKMNKLSFGSYNDNFKPNRTDYDWLSRDNAEVDKYIADPYCGSVCSSQFYYDFMDGLVTIFKKSNVNNVPKDLPLLIISGSLDPVGAQGKGVTKLKNMYDKVGIKDVTMKLYPDARHEILNEINRDEVMNDIGNWLKQH